MVVHVIMFTHEKFVVKILSKCDSISSRGTIGNFNGF